MKISSHDLSGMCRVCLAGRLQLYGVKNKQLQVLYESLSKTEFGVVTGTNVTMCYICYYQLKKIWKFSKVAQRTNKILYDLVDRGIEITNESIEYNALCIQHSLSIAMIPPIVIDSGINEKIKKECIQFKDIELLKEDYINPSLTMTCSSPKENLEQNKTFVGVNRKLVVYPSKPIILKKSKQSKRFKLCCVSPVTSNREKSKEDKHLSIPRVDKMSQMSNNLNSIPNSSIMYKNIEKEEICTFELHDNESQSSDNVLSVPITNNVHETMEEEICLEFNVIERQTGNAITDVSITSNVHQTEEGDIISHCELTDNANQTSDAKAGYRTSKQYESLEKEKICFSDLNDNEREAKIEECIDILLTVNKKPRMQMVWFDRCRVILRLLIKLAGSEQAGAKLLAERILPLFREDFTQTPTLSNLLEIAGIKNKAQILESIPQLSAPVTPSIVQEPASNCFETRLPQLFIEIPFSTKTPAEIVHEDDDDETLMQPIITNAFSLDKVLEEESHRKECIPVDSILDNSMFSSVIEVRMPPIDNLLCLSPEANDINKAELNDKNKNDVSNSQQLKMRSCLNASARKEMQKLKKLRKTNPEIARYIEVRRVSLEPSREEEQKSAKTPTSPKVVLDDPSVQDAGPDVTLKTSRPKKRKSRFIHELSQKEEWKSREDSTPPSSVSDDPSLPDIALQPSEQKKRKSSVILELSQEECRKSRAALIPPSDVLNDSSVPGVTPELNQQKRRKSGGVIEASQEKKPNSTEASAPPSVVSDDPLIQDADPDVILTLKQKKKTFVVIHPLVLLDKLSVAEVTPKTKRRKSSHRVVKDKPLLSEAPKERNIQLETMLDKFAKFKEKLNTPQQQKQVKSRDTSVKSTAKKRQKSTAESISIFKRTL